MVSTGLIAALPEESSAFLRQLLIWEVSRLGAFPGWRFRLGGLDCRLVQSGMGPKRAAEATRALLAEISPGDAAPSGNRGGEVAGVGGILSFGVAGAVQANLQIGDVVVVRSVCQLEQGVAGPLARLADLPGEARQAAAEALRARGARLVDGTAVTTRGEQKLDSQSAEMENPVLEMETAAIAAAAAQAGVPLLALRGISDNPQEPIPLDLAEMLDGEYRLRPGKMLEAVLRRPHILPLLRRFQRNTRQAAENVAAAVIAVLGAWHTFSE